MVDLEKQLAAERLAIETLYRAFSDKKPDLIDQAVTPDWDDIPLAPGQGPGPEGIKPIIRSLAEALPDVQITIKDIIHVPGHAGVRAELTGTHKGSLFGIEPTNKKVTIGIHEFHKLNGEKITATWHMEDWLGCFMQLGQFPPMP